jgi:hypothetical protein
MAIGRNERGVCHGRKTPAPRPHAAGTGKGAAGTWFDRPNPNLLGRRPIDEIEAGGEAIVAMMLDHLKPPEEHPYA